MKLLITILILATVLIAGCTQISSIGTQASTTNIGSIIKTPENYVNKSVTIKGTLPANFPYQKTLNDDQGYAIELKNCDETGRTYYDGIYSATGVIRSRNDCTQQQYRQYWNITKEEYSTLRYPSISINETIPSSDEEGWIDDAQLGEWCTSYGNSSLKSDVIENIPFSIFTPNPDPSYRVHFALKMNECRCKPNSTQKNYYFECTESLVKIS